MSFSDEDLARFMSGGPAPAIDHAQALKALQGATELAMLLTRFRAALIIGGCPESDATEMMREYFDMLVTARCALGDPDEDEEEDR